MVIWTSGSRADRGFAGQVLELVDGLNVRSERKIA